MTSNLREGDRIVITGGKYNGNTAIIRRVNRTRHWVKMEPELPGNYFIAAGLCFKLPSAPRVLVEELEVVDPPPQEGNVPGDEEEEPGDEGGEEEEESSEEGLSNRFGGQLATRFLIDLLAQSIATLGPENLESLEEWMNVLRERILHYCPEYPQDEPQDPVLS